MRLYFIRHGDPDYQHDSLTERGKMQAQKLAAHIHELKLDEIYSSPHGRAVQTATYSAEKLGLEVKILPWLKEVLWGDFSGDAYSTESPWSINGRFLASRHAYPEGESWKTDEAVKNDRIVGDVEEKCAKLDEWLDARGFEHCGQLYKVKAPLDAASGAKQKNIAFFCHGGVSTALTGHLLNIPFWQMVSHFIFDVTSVTCVEISECASAGESGAHFASAQLICYNDTHHLQN